MMLTTITLLTQMLFFGVSLSTKVSKDLIDCQQKGNCGISAICSYSFVYNEPCVTYSNCTRYKDILLEGNIMLIKNGLNKVTEYTWDIVGYNGYSYEDDDTARKYMLPGVSIAYIDTGIPMAHTVKLINNGETIDTKASSKRTCTIHEACQYLLRACQSSFIFVTTNSMDPKINCLLRSKACNYFTHLPDLAYSVYDDIKLNGNDESQNGNQYELDDTIYDKINDEDNDNTEGLYDSLTLVEKNNLKAKMEIYKNGASTCMVDCIWSWFPTRLLPTKDIIITLTKSLDIIRRLHFGMTMEINECNEEIVFTDDNIDIYHTTKDDELMALLNRGEDGGIRRNSQNTAILVWMIIFLVIILICFMSLCCYFYYHRYFKKGKSIFGHNQKGTKYTTGGSDTVSHVTF